MTTYQIIKAYYYVLMVEFSHFMHQGFHRKDIIVIIQTLCDIINARSRIKRILHLSVLP